jgi:hypothetical protein
MSGKKFIERMTGYKATNKDIQCLNFQFTPGEWHEHEGEIALCGAGFHFCDHPSGPWAYCSDHETRIWKVEAEQILDLPTKPGADHKRVCKRIRLVEELRIVGNRNTGNGNTGNGNTGNRNTGNRNTGDCNTGDRNTGYGNTGDCNTGDRNTGYCNTGDRNTGYGNTGNRNTGNRNTGDGNTGYGNTGNRNTGYGNTGDGNTGNRNTGYGNTGDGNTGYGNTGDGNTGYGNTGNRNTGDGNTGYGNTGYGNTGDGNTGNGNATNCSSGFFCTSAPKVLSFDEPTEFTSEEYCDKFPQYLGLCKALALDAEIDFERFKELPNITPEKIKALHEQHKKGREAA